MKQFFSNRRRTLPALFGVAAGAMAHQPQSSPVIITPGPTTFGPPRPVNGECPACRTKHKPLREEETGSRAYQMRCTFCSCLFVIDAVE